MLFEDLGITNIYAYALAAFLIILCPGPNSLYVLACAVKYGRAAALRALSAVFIGDSLLISASYLGIASLLKASPGLFWGLRAAGAAYLCFLGFRILRAALKGGSGPAGEERDGDGGRHAKSFRTAFILSLTNPKAILFFMALFVQFIDEGTARTGLCYLILAAILQFFSLCYLMTLTLFGRALVPWVRSRPALGRCGGTLTGSVFILFAARLMIDA